MSYDYPPSRLTILLSLLVFKFEQSSNLLSLKNSCPCRDLIPGPPRYQADMLPIELSWLGLISQSQTHKNKILRYNYKVNQIQNPNLTELLNLKAAGTLGLLGLD